MTQTTWDPSTNNGLSLSNGNLTATGPGSSGGIVGAYGTTPIASGEKVYFEIGTDGFYPNTGFTLGIAHHGWDWNTDRFDNGVLDRTDPAPGYADDLTVHWDGVVDEGGSWISNPHRITASMQNGGTLDFAVDTVDHKLWWRSSLTGQWDENPNDNPATNTGGIDVSALGGADLYPVVTDWVNAGAAATINGGTASFRDSVPNGFTPLDGLSGGSVNGGSTGGGASDGSGTGSGGGASAGSGGDPAAVTIGSGPDSLALQVAEDAWNGDAQFTISIDGAQIGGTQTATASHGAGQAQTFNVQGSFGAGDHSVAIDFLNDAYGGSAATDRNLYVGGATIDGTAIPGATLAEYSQGPRSFNFMVAGSTGAGSTGARSAEDGSSGPGSSGTGSSGSGTSTDIVTIDRPGTLAAGLQTITGTESDPSQAVFVNWHSYGTPASGDTDWVAANVDSGGHFSASLDIDHAGLQSTMFYRIGSGPAIAAWSGTPA